MDKNQPRDAKNGKKAGFSRLAEELFCTESILLQGEGRAVLYGCGRILFLGCERICFAMGKRSACVLGKALRCTVFSPTGVTVEGEIEGAVYCSERCNGVCQKDGCKEGEV